MKFTRICDLTPSTRCANISAIAVEQPEGAVPERFHVQEPLSVLEFSVYDATGIVRVRLNETSKPEAYNMLARSNAGGLPITLLNVSTVMIDGRLILSVCASSKIVIGTERVDYGLGASPAPALTNFSDIELVCRT